MGFVSMGIIGIVVPAWPTTIFMILALFCFKRSSPRLEEWLLSNRYFGSTLRDWDETRSMTTRAKMISISMIWVTISISIWLVSNPQIRVGLALLAVALTIYLIQVKSKPKI